MTEQDPAKKERELAGLRIASRILALILILTFGLVAFMAISISAKVEAILEAMLVGAPLPALTQLVFSQRTLIMIFVFFLSILSTLGVLYIKKPFLVVLIGGGTALLMIVATIFIAAASLIPLSAVTMEMGN